SSSTKYSSKKSSSRSTKNSKSNKPRKNKQTILEETVRKIMQSELKLLFPFLLPGVEPAHKTTPQESGSNKANSVKQVPPIPAIVE
ncbi:6346_t:CDS:1, partial [Funneliformis mosseae]